MSLSPSRVRAVFTKEVREFRRNRSITAGMAIIPLVFSVQPLISIFALQPAASAPLAQEHVLLYMLGIPALVPSLIAAYSVVGERQQGTLEPVLTTPIRADELLLGKALATFLPAVAIAYAVYGLFLLAVELFAADGVASALIRPSDLIAQLLFTPLLAGWSIWLAIVISTRSSDVRVAQQFATLASLPTVALTTLIALNVIQPSPRLAVTAAVVLILLNVLGWKTAAKAFDRETLITNTRS